MPNANNEAAAPQDTEFRDSAELKYYRHPYDSTAYYGAYGPDRLRVKRGEQWGEFDRNGQWLGRGEVRFADPTFCRWVTGEHIYNAKLIASGTKLFATTRLAAQRALTSEQCK